MQHYDNTDLQRAATAAIRAPSMHNSQPWHFRLRNGTVEVLADRSRQLATADTSGWALRIACGAATFNARLALATNSTPAIVLFRPDDHDTDLIARLTPDARRPASYTETDLYAAVEYRRSHRLPFWPDPVPPEVRQRLIEAARAESCWVDLLVGMTALTGFAEIAQSADRVLRRDERYQAELSTWVHAEPSPDGIPVTAGAPTAEPQDLLPQRPISTRTRAPGRDYEPEPLIAILGTPADRAYDQFIAGQAMQRVLLTATDASLATSIISQPIEVPAAREQLRRSLNRTGTPQIALRIGYGHPGTPTPRRPLTEVIVD